MSLDSLFNGSFLQIEMYFCLQTLPIIIILKGALRAQKEKKMYVSGTTVDLFKQLPSRFFLGSSGQVPSYDI